MNKVENSFWYNQIMGNWQTGINSKLLDLAQQYYDRTERYDRIVCTGPIRNGSIMPADGTQFSLINRNARRVMNELMKEVIDLGFGFKDFKNALDYLNDEKVR